MRVKELQKYNCIFIGEDALLFSKGSPMRNIELIVNRMVIEGGDIMDIFRATSRFMYEMKGPSPILVEGEDIRVFEE